MLKARNIKNILIVSSIIAILFPLVNIYFIFPSFTKLLIDNTEDEAERTAMYLSSILIAERTELRKDFLSDNFINDLSSFSNTFFFESSNVFSP